MHQTGRHARVETACRAASMNFKGAMSFESYFRVCSYAMIACGVLALAVSGGVGAWLAAMFAAVMVVSWRLAQTRWQMSERAGLVVVLLALPAFYLDWNFQRGGADAA